MEKPTSKLAYTVEQACEAVGLGRNYLYVAISKGQLRSFKAGRRRLISAKALQEYIASMEAAFGSSNGPNGATGAHQKNRA